MHIFTCIAHYLWHFIFIEGDHGSDLRNWGCKMKTACFAISIPKYTYNSALKQQLTSSILSSVSEENPEPVRELG